MQIPQRNQPVIFSPSCASASFLKIAGEKSEEEAGGAGRDRRGKRSSFFYFFSSRLRESFSFLFPFLWRLLLRDRNSAIMLTSLLNSPLAALSLRACSSLRYASTTTAAAAASAAVGNAAATTTTKRRRRSRADEEVAADSSSSADSSTSSSSSSSTSASSSRDAWRASLPDDAPATALAAALRRSLALSGTKPESALVFVADRVRTLEDAAAAFDAAAALRAARVRRGQRGELRPQAHAALADAAVRAAAAEVLGEAGGLVGGSAESDEELSRLLAATLGRCRQAGMPVGARTFSEAAKALQRAVRQASSTPGGAEEHPSSDAPLLATAARGVLAAALGCRVRPTPALAAALVDAAAWAGGEPGARAAEALAAEFEANGVRLSPFAVRALERSRSRAAAAAESAAAGTEEVEEGGKGE